MKKIHIIIAAIALTGTYTAQAYWFDNSERDLRHQLEQQLANERHANHQFEVATFVLGVGCVGALLIGAAIGSKAKRDSKKEVVHELSPGA